MIIYRLFGDSKKSGAYGSYYKYGRSTGIKVIWETETEGVSSLKYRVFNKEFFKVFIESTLFNLVHGKESSEVVICKIKERYYLGIKMPHFKGKVITSINRSFVNKNKKITKKRTPAPLIKEINSILTKKKLYNHDLHEGNVILSEDGIKVIDFSPDHIQFFGEKSVFNKEARIILNKFDRVLNSLCIKSCKKKLSKNILIFDDKVHNGSLV